MKRIEGLTLVEVMVTVIIIGVISIGAFAIFQYCQRYIVDSELRLIAVNFAQETMEELYWDNALAYTEDPDNEGAYVYFPSPTLLPADLEFASLLRKSYGGERHYKTEPDSSGNYRIIKVRVQWNY